MIYQSIKNFLGSKDLIAQLKTFSIMKHEGRLIFYHGALETGLQKILTKPLTLDEISGELNIPNKQLLSSLLDLGCSLRELSCKQDTYRLRGSMIKALVSNVPLAELIRETVQYHGNIASHLDTFLLKNEKGSYLKDFGGIIAESSRILEPFIKAFIYHTVKKKDPLTILEFGCGSGDYLKYYVDINKNNRGMAIDIDASAVLIAQEKLKQKNIEENFTVLQDNILNPETLGSKRFDLVTSFSNMHYFSREERIQLFEAIYNRLNDNGRFLLATGFKAENLSSSYYDLIFSATQGLYGLPDINDVLGDLKKTGFTGVKTVNLSGEAFKGIVAFKK